MGLPPTSLAWQATSRACLRAIVHADANLAILSRQQAGQARQRPRIIIITNSPLSDRQCHTRVPAPRRPHPPRRLSKWRGYHTIFPLTGPEQPRGSRRSRASVGHVSAFRNVHNFPGRRMLRSLYTFNGRIPSFLGPLSRGLPVPILRYRKVHRVTLECRTMAMVSSAWNHQCVGWVRLVDLMRGSLELSIVRGVCRSRA